jgi:hypothetical protein
MNESCYEKGGWILMNIVKDIDWQMVTFVATTLFNEYLINIRFPRIYYWDVDLEKDKKANNNNNRAA